MEDKVKVTFIESLEDTVEGRGIGINMVDCKLPRNIRIEDLLAEIKEDKNVSKQPYIKRVKHWLLKGFGRGQHLSFYEETFGVPTTQGNFEENKTYAVFNHDFFKFIVFTNKYLEKEYMF